MRNASGAGRGRRAAGRDPPVFASPFERDQTARVGGADRTPGSGARVLPFLHEAAHEVAQRSGLGLKVSVEDAIQRIFVPGRGPKGPVGEPGRLSGPLDRNETIGLHHTKMVS